MVVKSSTAAVRAGGKGMLWDIKNPNGWRIQPADRTAMRTKGRGGYVIEGRAMGESVLRWTALPSPITPSSLHAPYLSKYPRVHCETMAGVISLLQFITFSLAAIIIGQQPCRLLAWRWANSNWPHLSPWRLAPRTRWPIHPQAETESAGQRLQVTHPSIADFI